MMDWSGEMGSGGWVLMFIVWAILIAAVVWAAARLFGGTRRDGSVAASAGARDILDRRLASGEIDADGYDTLLAKLRAARDVGG